MPSIGTIWADLILRSASFISEFRKAANETARNTAKIQSQLSGIQSSVASAATALRGLFAAGIVAGAARSFISLGQTVIESADAIGDSARRIGASAEELQKLRFAADQANVSTGELDAALKVFGSRLAKGDLNTFQTTLTGALNEYIRRIQEAPAFIDKARIATEAFGRQWQIGLALGSDSAAKFAENARGAFFVSDALVRKADSLKDSWDRVRNAISAGFSTGFLEEFGKGLEENKTALNDLNAIARFAGEQLAGLFNAVVETARQTRDEYVAIRDTVVTLWEGLGNIVQSALSTIEAKLQSWKKTIVDTFTSIATTIANAWDSVITTITNAIAPILAELQPLQTAWDATWGAMKTVVDAIVAAIEAAVRRVQEFAATVKQAWNDIRGIDPLHQYTGAPLSMLGGTPAATAGAGNIAADIGASVANAVKTALQPLTQAITLPKFTDVLGATFGGGGGADSWLSNTPWQNLPQFNTQVGEAGAAVDEFGNKVEGAGATAGGAGNSLGDFGRGVSGSASHLGSFDNGLLNANVHVGYFGDGLHDTSGDLDEFGSGLRSATSSFGQFGSTLGGFGNGLGAAGLGLNSFNNGIGGLIPTMGFTSMSLTNLGRSADLASIDIGAAAHGTSEAFRKGFDFWASLSKAGTMLTQEFIRWQASLMSRRVIINESGQYEVAPAFGPGSKADWSFALQQRQKTQARVVAALAAAAEAKAAKAEERQRKKDLEDAMSDQAAQSGWGGVSAGKSLPSVHITLEGTTNLFTREQVIALIDQMGDAIGDGARISIA